jgi:S1-C subfamily serine protease
MKLHSLYAAAAVVALVAAPAWAGSGAKCTADTQTCLNHMAAKKSAGWIGVEFDKSTEGVMKVKSVVAGSPAEQAGIQPGDVLVALNGVKVSDHEAMKKAKGAWSVGQKVTYTVERKGTATDLAVTLGAMPDHVHAAMLGAHLMDNHVTTATAAAAEATPAK